MSRLIQIPSSNEIEKLDDFAVKYFDDFFMQNEFEDWIVYRVKMIQKVGAGTRIISHITSEVTLKSDRVENVDLSRDHNLSRIIGRIQKRRGSGEIQIDIFRSGAVFVS